MGPGRHAEHAEQDPTPRRVLGLFLDGGIPPVVPTVTASLAHDAARAGAMPSTQTMNRREIGSASAGKVPKTRRGAENSAGPLATFARPLPLPTAQRPRVLILYWRVARLVPSRRAASD